MLSNKFVNFQSSNRVAAWEGIRQISGNNFILSGALNGQIGCVYIGPLTGDSASLYEVRVPLSTRSSVYGPDVYDINRGIMRLVGTYKRESPAVRGFLFKGTVNDLQKDNHYKEIAIGYEYTYCHSIMGNVIVGNCDDFILDSQGNKIPLGLAKAFVYDLKTGENYSIKYPNSGSTTAYGVWYNGGTSYTICGGHTAQSHTVQDFEEKGVQPFEQGYLVDFDLKTKTFSNWKSYIHPVKNGITYNSHFEGLSYDNGIYYVVADSISNGTTLDTPGSWLRIKKDGNEFSEADWVDLAYPSGDNHTITSANSVAKNIVIGVALSAKLGTVPYQAEVIA